MSQDFNPETVERVSAKDAWPSNQVVRASDYDALYALYREATNAMKLQREFISEVRETCFDDSQWAYRIDHSFPAPQAHYAHDPEGK